MLALAACDTTTRDARHMVRRAEQLADTQPDSTLRLIDSVLHMAANFNERERMDMSLLQGEVLFGDRGQELSPVMDDDFFDDHGNVNTSPELERASAYYAKKKDYAKAAHAALYSGFVQQHYDEKDEAMQSFKEAEQYGELAGDSLTVAWAEYRMGKMLIDDGVEQEALPLLMAALTGFGNGVIDKALTNNMISVCYMLHGDFDNAEKCLRQSLLDAATSQSDKVLLKTKNNFAVLQRLQGKYDAAIACLREMADISNFDETEMFVYCLNMGKTFASANEMDSASLYFQKVEAMLPNTRIKLTSRISAYGALSQYTERQGYLQKALLYKAQREEAMSNLLVQIQKQNTYRIQRQYDYESLKNAMSQKMMQRHRIILVLSLVAILGLSAFALSRVKLARTRKEEAEAKANLFHFMQQNKVLAQKNEEQEQKSHKNELAYQNMLEKLNEQTNLVSQYGEMLTHSLKKEQAVMLRLHLFLENKGDEELLGELEESVFGKQEHWKAILEAVDQLYPQLKEIVSHEELGLDELEQKDVILSYIGVSRHDESLLLHKSTDMVDKIRNRSRKKIKSVSTGIKLP